MCCKVSLRRMCVFSFRLTFLNFKTSNYNFWLDLHAKKLLRFRRHVNSRTFSKYFRYSRIFDILSVVCEFTVPWKASWANSRFMNSSSISSKDNSRAASAMSSPVDARCKNLLDLFETEISVSKFFSSPSSSKITENTRGLL